MLRQDRRPARRKTHVPMPATAVFSASAVTFMVAAAVPVSAMSAR